MSSPITPNTTLSMTLSWKQLEGEYQKQVKRLSGRLKVPGFRPGKVPPALAEQHLNLEQLQAQVVDAVAPSALPTLLKKEQKTTLTYPSIRIKKATKGEDWELEVEIAEQPEVSIKDYAKIAKKALKEATAELAKLTEEERAKQERERKLTALFKALVTELKPTVPELLIRRETQYDLENLARTLQSMKLEFEAYLKHRQMSFDELSTELAARALGKWQIEFILQRITQDLNLKVSEKDITAKFSELEASHHHAKGEEHTLDQETRAGIEAHLLREKTLEALLALAA